MPEEKKRKPLDSRIQHLINNSVTENHRSLFVLIGNAQQQQRQIVNLHWLLSQARLDAPAVASTSSKKAASRPNVLWCYKKELGFTSNRKKREAKVKRDVKRGIRDEGDMDPFELFVGVTDIRYTYYKDSENILGQTFGMLVLQDFEALTPNLLARTIETVSGGGIVVILLQSMTSLKQLYTMSMDVHSRYRTESATSNPIARFNERFILSLGSCSNCLVLDDELNVLPISQAKDIRPIDKQTSTAAQKQQAQELVDLKSSLESVKPVGEVVKEASTLDQAKAILTFTDAIAAKTLSSTVALTAARGRGKSAALGLSIALAVAHSYSNIFVTSPSPENLKTLFEFVLKGFDKLGYEEHLDYDVVQSSNPEWKGSVVRINIFRDHRQTIQYIQPQDAHVLGQAELVVIDEAAAIPLPLVRALLGPYLVFMASTVNGYEGTGRSLSLKLIQQLRESANPSLSSNKADKSSKAAARGNASISRSFREIKLDQPIRYGNADQIEKWLNSLLCLDATITSQSFSAAGCPHPSQCELYYVDRDTLFSFHPASELFLQRMMALYVASHYKNSPNDLQLMSDAPGHALFVLLPPLKEGDRSLPDPLVVMQVALEGKISKQSVLNSLSRGIKASGDLIPWTVAQQFQDDEFAGLSGARVVRIAVHPDYAKMGYGSRALEALDSYYSGQLLNLNEQKKTDQSESFEQASKVDAAADIHTETIKGRDAATMPPLLHRLAELQPETLDYLGVSYGLTPQLFKFWKRAGYVPLYVRQTENELTGEHTCVMVRGLSSTQEETSGWLNAFSEDFRRRFISLLSYKFREFAAVTSLSVLEACRKEEVSQAKTAASVMDLRRAFSPFDMKRLNSYANNMLDYHAILDLLPLLAGMYFNKQLPVSIHLSAIQSAILLALGLQRKRIEDVEAELNLPVSQLLALFVKSMRKMVNAVEEVQKSDISTQLAQEASTNGPTSTKQKVFESRPAITETLEEELNQEGEVVADQLKEQQRQAVDSLGVERFAVESEDSAWQDADARFATMQPGKSTVVSIPSIKRKADVPVTNGKQEPAKKKHKKKRASGAV